MDPILLQKQVTENATELQNLVEDLIDWEKDMKRREQSQVQSTAKQEELPPVRTGKLRKKIAEEVSKTEPVTEILKENPNESTMVSEQLTERQKREKSLFEKERGNELVKQGKYSEAIYHYTQAIESYSQDSTFYTNRALCFIHTKQFKEAENDCTIALQLDPKNLKAYHRRATALRELNQLPEAHEALKKALSIEPKNNTLKADLIKVEKIINDRIAKSTASKESNKSNAYAFKDKGNAFVKKGNWQLAIENYTEACRLYPEDSIFYSNRAHCYLKLNEPKKAILDCIRALELNPNNSKALFKKALAYEELGHDSAAHDDLLACFQLCPDDKAVQEALNKIEKKLGLRKEPYEESKNTSTFKRITGERFLKLGGQFVDPIKKPPHLSSKESMKKIEISEKSEIDILQSTLNQIIDENKPPVEKRTAKVTQSPKIDVDSLPLPKTSMQFITSWNKLLIHPSLQYQYLKRLNGRNFPTVFKDALEPELFGEILKILATEFIKANEPVYDYLYGLSNVNRFSALILFASEEDKENIKLVIDHCNNLNEVAASELSALKSRFYY